MIACTMASLDSPHAGMKVVSLVSTGPPHPPLETLISRKMDGTRLPDLRGVGPGTVTCRQTLPVYGAISGFG